MAIELREMGDRKTRKDFLQVTKRIYEGDPCWVRPLDMDVAERLDHKKNPFFEHAEGTAWVAYKDGVSVGRISAQVDHEHLRVAGRWRNRPTGGNRDGDRERSDALPKGSDHCGSPCVR